MCCCCCCRCNGSNAYPYIKPDYLDYEDDVFILFEKRVVDFEIERERIKQKAIYDFEVLTGIRDENGEIVKKKEKKRGAKNKLLNLDEDKNIETGQLKE